MTDALPIVEVTSDSFPSDVLEASRRVPVLVDFWAAWCAPCQMLMPVLHSLAEEYHGQFILAKVNSDEQQELAMEYGVRSLPTVKVFRHGQVVDEFLGGQPESVIREMIERHIERESDRLREKARAALSRGETAAARELLERARSIEPHDHVVTMDLAEIALQEGEPAEAQQLVNELPLDKRESDEARNLLGRAQFAAAVEGAPDISQLERTVEADPTDLAARHLLAARYITEGNYAAGMDQLLEIMRRDRDFRDDIARKGLLAAFPLVGDEELVNRYRRKMAQLLY